MPPDRKFVKNGTVYWLVIRIQVTLPESQKHVISQRGVFTARTFRPLQKPSDKDSALASAHEIRLAGPWEYSLDAGSTWTRSQLPFDLSAVEIAAEICLLRRKFHRPSGLEDSSRVFIRIDTDTAPVNVTVNDLPTADIVSDSQSSDDRMLFDVEITNVLSQFNTLLLTIDCDHASTVRAVSVRIVEQAD